MRCLIDSIKYQSWRSRIQTEVDTFKKLKDITILINVCGIDIRQFDYDEVWMLNICFELFILFTTTKNSLFHWPKFFGGNNTKLSKEWICLWKFIYSEKAINFCQISTLGFSYVETVKCTVEISQNFVAFSEYMNFMANYDKYFKSVCKHHLSLFCNRN